MKKHKKQVKADRKRVQKKFFEAHDIEAPPAEDIAGNDAGLPAPALSEQGRFVELWAKFGSWGICKACQNGKVHIPEFEEVVKALRPLNIDAGPYRRAAYGYRVHSAMIRLAWAAASVLEKIGSCRARRGGLPEQPTTS